MRSTISAGLIFAFVILLSETRGNWPQFRGPNGSGDGGATSAPVHFGPGHNELWRVKIESGHSSPVVFDDSVFLTCYEASQRQLSVVCLDRHNGQVRWRRLVNSEEIEKGHPSFNPASSTAACDGQHVIAYFGSFGLLCYDMQGNPVWQIPMPLTRSYAGNATSPIIAGDRVILYRGNEVDHYLLAVDKVTGEELWRVDQEEPFAAELACTACPIVADDKLIVHSARSVQAFDVADGRLIWVVKCATTATSTPVLAGEDVIVAAWNKMGEPALRPEFPGFDELVKSNDSDGDGLISAAELPRMMIFHRPEGAEAPENGGSLSFRSADANKDGKIDAGEWRTRMLGIERFRRGYEQHGLLAIRRNSTGIVPTGQVRTLAQQGIPEVPSPLFRDGLVYFLKNGGLLTCLEADSGKLVYRTRTKGRGTHYASPVFADGKLYCTAGNGRISVVAMGAKPTILAVNEMQDNTYATPAIVEGALYVRTHHHLFAFRTKE